MNFACTELPVMTSVRQAYSCLWHYKFQHILISLVAVLPFCLAGLGGYLDPVMTVSSVTENLPDGFNLAFGLLVLTTFIWAFPVIILWHRLYLLGPEHLFRKKVWPLITRSLTVISHSLVFFGIGLVAAVGITWGLLYLRVKVGSEEMIGTLTEMSQMEYALYTLGLLTVIGFLVPISLRFSMAFSAQAIGKSLGFGISWDITRRNTFRMLLATLVGFLPVVALVGLTLWAAKHYWGIDLFAGTAPEMDLIYKFVLIFSPILTLPMAIFCSLTSTFYRHCGCADVKSTDH